MEARRRIPAAAWFAGFAVLLAVVAFVVTRRLAVVDKSIAVLPFENRSTEKDSAFFTDGIQEDILTNSRTSASCAWSPARP